MRRGRVEGQSLEHGPRGRVGVRRPLALEVRQERQPLRPGGPARRLGDQLVVRLRRPRRAASCSEPAAESITPIASHVSGHGVAEDVDACLRVGAVAGSAAKTTPDVPSTTDSGPGPTTPTPSAPACWSPAPPIAVDSCASRQPLERDLQRRADLLATNAARRRRRAASPTPPRRRSPARRSAAAGRSPSGRSTCAACAHTSGSCLRTQTSFGAVNPGSARLPVSSTSREKPTVSSISAHSAPVRWSFQRIAGRSTRSAAVEQHEAVHLAGQPDRPVAPDGVERRLGRAPPVLGILLGPARLRDRERVLLLGPREHLAGLGDRGSP